MEARDREGKFGANPWFFCSLLLFQLEARVESHGRELEEQETETSALVFLHLNHNPS